MLKERLNVFRVEGSSFFDSLTERICSAQDFSVVWLEPYNGRSMRMNSGMASPIPRSGRSLPVVSVDLVFVRCSTHEAR